MKREVIISYNWWRPDGSPVKENHTEALEETAMDRITEMMKQGYTSGELLDNIRMCDDDGEEGISYNGWWGLTTRIPD